VLLAPFGRLRMLTHRRATVEACLETQTDKR
jgi:hypothetical protein